VQTLIAVMGVLVTVMVVAGMVLMTTRSVEADPTLARTPAAGEDVARAPTQLS
jgi:hypothetical protein